MNKAARPFWVCTLAVVGLAAFIRLYALSTYPVQFNQDEMTMGYDAWSLWQTGRDQHGEVLPLFFRTFGDYVSPVANYLDAPFVGLLGLNEFTTRLPVALLGTLTVFLAALLGRAWFSPAAGVVAALLMAVEPWLVNYGRIAFPASLVPFFTTAALYCFTHGITTLQDHPERRRSLIGWLMGSGLCFALLTATYPVMKLQGPLLLVICILAAAPLLWRHRWTTVYWLIFFLLCINPYFSQQLFRWSTVQARFDALSSQHAAAPRIFLVLQIYLSHFDPRAIFSTGFAGGVAVLPPGIGELSWLVLPLLLAGVIGLVYVKPSRRLGFNLTLVLLLWLLTYPIADSLAGGAFGGAHEIRSTTIFPLPELLAGYGALVLWQTLTQYRRSLAYLAAIGGGVCFIAFSAIFLAYFFNPAQLNISQPQDKLPFNVGLGPMVETAAQNARSCDQIWMANAPQQSYMYYLFLSKYPPRQFQVFSSTQISSDAINHTGFDRVRFGTPPDRPPELANCHDQPYRLWWIIRQPPPSATWTPIAVYHDPAGVPIWYVVVRTISPDAEF